MKNVEIWQLLIRKLRKFCELVILREKLAKLERLPENETVQIQMESEI